MTKTILEKRLALTLTLQSLPPNSICFRMLKGDGPTVFAHACKMGS